MRHEQALIDFYKKHPEFEPREWGFGNTPKRLKIGSHRSGKRMAILAEKLRQRFKNGQINLKTARTISQAVQPPEAP